MSGITATALKFQDLERTITLMMTITSFRGKFKENFSSIETKWDLMIWMKSKILTKMTVCRIRMDNKMKKMTWKKMKKCLMTTA